MFGDDPTALEPPFEYGEFKYNVPITGMDMSYTTSFAPLTDSLGDEYSTNSRGWDSGYKIPLKNRRSTKGSPKQATGTTPRGLRDNGREMA